MALSSSKRGVVRISVSPIFIVWKMGALLYPSEHIITSKKWGLNGCGRIYAVISFQIPNGCQSLENFVELMSLKENDFAGAFYEQNTIVSTIV